ncbi:YtxH domain-containing protein [Flavobacterium sp.]|uniref:YtxH domain-containing protein n=1 Tax=Flavobacterium sp. TaxID=239 RepID=UPI00375029F5
MKSSKLLLGVIGGVAVGTVLGILFAPAKGSETRKNITNKGSGFKETFKETATKIANTISETSNGFKKEAKELASDGEANLENIKDIKKSSVV